MDFNDKNDRQYDAYQQAQEQQAEMMRAQMETEPEVAQPVYQQAPPQQPAYQAPPQQPFYPSDAPQGTPYTPYQVPQTPQYHQAQAQVAHDPVMHNTLHHTAPQEEQPFANDPYAQQTYHAWQAQKAKHAKPPRRRKKNRAFRKVLVGLGVIAAAASIFVGGLAAGGAFGSENVVTTTTPSVSASTAEAALDENVPSLEITSTPTITASTSTDGVLSGAEIFEKCSPSVVAITAVNLATGSGGTGSGVIMTEDGYIITNAHVVSDETTGEGLDMVTVILNDGTSLSATIVGLDTTSDIAVLKATTEEALTPAEFGDSSALLPGSDCYAIGSPSGVLLANTITSGTISALNREITIDDLVMTLIQIDASINPGNSGGALINEYGQVVGITSAKLGIGEYEGLGFAIPINSAKEIVDSLITYGYVPGRPQIGLMGYDLSEAMATGYGLPMGVLVDSVDSRSNAALAGLQKNDVIIGINGVDITTMDEINAVKEDLVAGDTITLNIYRIGDGREYTIEFLLNDAYDFEGTDPATITTQDSTITPDSYYGSSSGSNGSSGSSGYGGYYDEYYFNPFGGY